jgi:hypothetical protein
MQTDCTTDLFGFAPVEGREVVAAFDGGAMTSDAGALLLGETDRAIGMMRATPGRDGSCDWDDAPVRGVLSRCPATRFDRTRVSIGS